MDKLEFVSRQFAKAEKKKYEHYVVTRIWHLLNDARIKFITQQFITRPTGKALTDMYFPQLEIHIEVDEGHHKKQIQADKLREADIINATGHKIFRIDVTTNIDEVNEGINEIIAFMKNKIKSSNDFKAWDLDAEQNPKTYIERGYIDLKDDVAFRRMSDAASCFGKNYKGLQRSYIPHPKEPDTRLWFPKLYKNGEWINQISEDECIITARSEFSDKTKEIVNEIDRNKDYFVVVFARVKSPLGDLMYRFKGKYQLDQSKTNYENGHFWKRVETRVKTYSN